MFKIHTVTRYRATYKSPYGRYRIVERATQEAVYRKLAWWMIRDRHGMTEDGWGDLSRVEEVHRYRCECNSILFDDDWESPDKCPIHDPDNGYFRRLSRRITRWLEGGYIQPRELQ